tara:strand:+ start:58 stop:969 length:912 start_codon:yes stop_codon:yes gene_type:complete
LVKLPSGVDIDHLICDLRNFSWEAAEIMLYYSNKINRSENTSNIIYKNDIDGPVTKADLEVNEIIIKRISQKYRDVNWAFLSEENVKLGIKNDNRKTDWVWVFDPLDGTKDFIQGTGNYAMHLALSYQNKTVIGIVLIPERNELWISNGYEVWCEDKDRSQKNYKLSKNKIIEGMTLVTSKNHNNEYLETLINKIQFKDVVTMGSIGCKIASILRGESDIYISLSVLGKSYPKDWDFAAPEAILTKAGGAITNLNNQEIVYTKSNFNQSGILIASNCKNNQLYLCNEIKRLIRDDEIFDEFLN